MKYKYTKFIEDLLDGIDMESLVSQLSDLLLSSGFNNPWDPQSDDDRTLQTLHDAILDALLNGGALSEEMLQRLLADATAPRSQDVDAGAASSQLEALVQRIIERMTEQGATAERLKSLRAKDPTLSAAVDALDLELLE